MKLPFQIVLLLQVIMNKNQFSDIVKIITNYTGDDNPTVLFNNSNGDTVAETSTFGKIKLDN